MGIIEYAFFLTDLIKQNYNLIIRCTFTTNDLCLEWFKRLTRAIALPKNVQDVFAFAFHAWAIEDQCNEISLNLGHDVDDDYFLKEVKINNNYF